jgi:holliday junction DNA helicase RuvA
MIGKLKGRIDSFGADWLIIDVSGVGYHVNCSSKTLAALPSVGEFTELHTEMLVSQDMIRLVGFASVLEREWFRLLQTVQGVGTRVALAILSTLSASEIGNAIALQDKPMIGRAPGVGKKLAERIVLELKDKVPAFSAGGDAALVKLQAELDAPRPTAASDAVSALVNLGYGQSQAGTAVASAMRKNGDDQPTEKLIRQALKELALL